MILAILFPELIYPFTSGFVTPFTIFHHTNELEGGDNPSEVDNRGFCLNYSQQPCA